MAEFAYCCGESRLPGQLGLIQLLAIGVFEEVGIGLDGEARDHAAPSGEGPGMVVRAWAGRGELWDRGQGDGEFTTVTECPEIRADGTTDDHRVLLL
jgi:hypothetical protein